MLPDLSILDVKTDFLFIYFQFLLLSWIDKCQYCVCLFFSKFDLLLSELKRYSLQFGLLNYSIFP